MTTGSLHRTVAYLCSDACAGRRPGTPEGRAAREYIAATMGALGLVPAGEPDRSATADGPSYLQSLDAIEGANVLGLLPGAGPRADRTVILAAHHDVWCDPAWPAAYRGATTTRPRSRSSSPAPNNSCPGASSSTGRSSSALSTPRNPLTSSGTPWARCPSCVGRPWLSTPST